MRSVFKMIFTMIAVLPLGAGAYAASFAPCPDAASSPTLHGSQCLTETVPLKYEATLPVQESITLFVRKFPARRTARGTVWLLAGGPGESGASLYPFLDVLRRTFVDYDLVIPDHRGTGFSTRLCPEEESVAGAGGTALAGAEWGSCFGSLHAQADRARDFSVTHAAHDLHQLLARHRDGKPRYLYAVSYGTQLALRAALVRPLPVDGLILDSLVPSEDHPGADLSRRSQLVDAVGRSVLAQCDARPDCHAALGEPAEAVYQRLLARSKEQPELLDGVPGKDLPLFLAGLLDIPRLRERIPYLLKEIDAGGKRELQAVLAELKRSYASIEGFPQSPFAIPLVSVVSLSENNQRPWLSPAALKAEEGALLFKSSIPDRMAGSTLPVYPRDAYFGRHPARLPPTLVLSGTMDPKTGYAEAMAHAAHLRAAGKVAVVTLRGAPHFSLWVAPGCFERHAGAFVRGQRLRDAECIAN